MEPVVTYFSLVFWRKAAERAIKSAGQGAVAVIALGVAAGAAGQSTVNAFLVDWKAALGGAAGMAVLSLGTSIATAKIGPADDPGVV